MTKEELREIATAIYPKCIETLQTVLMRGQSCGEETPQAAAAKMAIRYAAELGKQINIYTALDFNKRKDF